MVRSNKEKSHVMLHQEVNQHSIHDEDSWAKNPHATVKCKI